MYETLKQILVIDLGLADTGMTPKSSLEDVDLDSLSLVELAMVLEKKHGIVISDDEMASVRTVGDIADLMAGHSAVNGR